MKTNLTVIGVLIFCITASLIIPKVADATGNLESSLSSDVSGDRISINKPEQSTQDLYVPPNYGGPDSQHGSGTR
ncbi:hypothetical protein NOS3756_47960 [Nostoc sp. NIES-3756]|uniref:hypothetical protein n=1 Tax=Nostoc sp. NIES-3756 TaxID=1751286 RepID=UPI0007208120|nr:hypothetical protein [Nostoc sp. NIES-3756]BAT55803.1 hypothetical protein NOS3756_47960 [Nostoc sp. NIES-3756]BAY36436.1 hypothetical protein NIES2111_07630 [Nostoc sp. NIES-2111]